MACVSETGTAVRGNMLIQEVKKNKKDYLSLLLLADEQEDMIDRYLKRGTMYVLLEQGLKAECIVTDEGNGILEIKSLAVVPEAQRQGYGRKMLAFIQEKYRGQYRFLQLGTGDSPLTIPFYESCGFQRVGCLPDFFVKNYDHPIYEAGVQLKDMIILQLAL